MVIIARCPGTFLRSPWISLGALAGSPLSASFRIASYRRQAVARRALLTVASGEVNGPVAARVASPSFCGRDMQAEQVREYGGGEVGGEGYDRGVPSAA